MAATNNRLEISRLIHRFGFGPRPGEFGRLLAQGLVSTRNQLLTPPLVDSGLSQVGDPGLTDLGPMPKPNSPQVIPFASAMHLQSSNLLLWWLDRMVLAEHGLTERMTWFWHGHWATSIGKVQYALPMKIQNDTLRKYALGNFQEMATAMIHDGALQYWLDGNKNQQGAPNENLARELMELFTLGVDQYTEDDIKALAKALTGFSVTQSNGATRFNPAKHDASVITVLGTTGTLTPDAAVTLITNRPQCARFIAQRLWFRFISTSTPMPDQIVSDAFSTREISAAVKALATHSGMSDPANAQVKSPVEWFVAACRALKLTPSKLQVRGTVAGFLDKLGQLPFQPPNVGGWPYDEAWLNAASTQYRLSFSDYLVKQGDLSPIANTTPENRISALADHLGVYRWSDRTIAAFAPVTKNPARLFLLALNAPEYLVNG